MNCLTKPTGFVLMAIVKTNEVNERITMSDPKYNAVNKSYKLLDGTTLRYGPIVKKVTDLLVTHDELTATDITHHLKLESGALVFLLPYMLSKNRLRTRRTIQDKLLYSIVKTNLLQELLIPKPKFKLTGTSIIHRVKHK